MHTSVLHWNDFILRLLVAVLAGALIGLEPAVTAVRWQAIKRNGQQNLPQQPLA